MVCMYFNNNKMMCLTELLSHLLAEKLINKLIFTAY